jgi:hypothetical protein
MNISTKRKFALAIALALLGLSAAPDVSAARSAEISDSGTLRVAVDPRVELFSIIFRLAGNPEYAAKDLKGYVEDVEKTFAPFREHPVVRFAAKLKETRGISFNAPLSLGLHLKDTFGFQEAVSLDATKTLDDRWTKDEARRFILLAKDFVRASRFNEFYERHKDLYDRSIKSMEDLVRRYRVPEWFASFFGNKENRHFVVVIGMQDGAVSYSQTIDTEDGKETIYCVKGAWRADPSGAAAFSDFDLPVVVHEFCHAIANPLIDANLEKLKVAGETLYPFVEFDLKKDHYGTWKVMFYESLVRALVVKYLFSGADAERAERQLDEEMTYNGFPWLRDLCVLLGDYEKNRKQYPTLDAFAERIVFFFQDYAKNVVANLAKLKDEEKARWKEIEGRAPKVVSMNIKDRDMNVDPDLKEITITFDQPMRGLALMQFGSSDHFPEFSEDMRFDDSGRTLTLPVTLRPNRYYIFGLNSKDSLGFQNQRGVPLIPVVVRFKTGAANEDSKGRSPERSRRCSS